MKDYFSLLEVDRTASTAEIKRAYQAKALKYHPDKRDSFLSQSQKDDYDAMFLLIQKAWEILQSPEKAATYRTELENEELQHESPPMNGFIDMEEMHFCEEDGYLVYPCRCGGEYEVHRDDILPEGGIVQCSLCSLNIGVNPARSKD